MALEDAMLKLAESNLKLADAQTHYAGIIEKFGTMVVQANGGDDGEAAATAATDDKPAKKAAAKKATKKAAAKKAAETADDFGGDGFGGDDEGSDGEADVPAKLTADQIKAKLLEVRDAYGDKAPALKIINDLGYSAIPDVKPADYAAVWKACEKAIADADL